MFDWFYTKAKQLKQAAFSSTGVAVAVSTASSLVASTTSWMMNLVAITGGGLYSIFKNMETAQAITQDEKEVQQLAQHLRLEDYQDKAHPISLSDILAKTSLEIPVDLMTEIKRTEEDLEKSTPESFWYANANLVLQSLLSGITLVFNTFANLEEDEKDRTDPSTTKNILNTTLVFLCICAQYVLHSAYVAKNLRGLATSTENLKHFLSEAEKSLVFRTYEVRLFTQHREKAEIALEKCQENIAKIQKEQTAYDGCLLIIEHELEETQNIDNRQRQDALRKEQADIQSTLNDLDSQLKQQKTLLETLETKTRLLEDKTAKFREIKIKIETERNAVNELIDSPLEIQEVKI